MHFNSSKNLMAKYGKLQNFPMPYFEFAYRNTPFVSHRPQWQVTRLVGHVRAEAWLNAHIFTLFP